MNQTESMAFWISFVSSITGIVLSIVAIVFSILVDRRSSTISDKTIQSLQKIESAVERTSSDTRELVKAGWDKMLGQVDKEGMAQSNESSAKQVAAGIAAELRSEISALANGKVDSNNVDAKNKQLDGYLKELEAGLSAQLSTARSESKSGGSLEVALEQIRGLDERTLGLLRGIRRYHLTQEQYKQLSEGSFGNSIRLLRRHGLLAPVVHKTDHGPEPCYYMPPGTARAVREAILLFPKPSPSIEHDVSTELAKISYRHSDDE